MIRMTRVGGAALALALAGAAPALAQIPGMPLFTNPRYATGIRVHADIGKPTERDPSGADLRVIQAGLGFVLGPVGIDANVGSTKETIDAAHGCTTGPNVGCADSRATVSALAQLRVMGGGHNNLSLSLFGGGSMDLDTAEALAGGSLGSNKLVTIPVGAAIGLRIPLGVASLNVWGAPRYVMGKFVNCASSGCASPNPKGFFAWAVGADFPIFRILSIRGAFDSHSVAGHTVNVIGVGASIGIGGMR